MTNNNVNISQRFFVTLLRFCVHTTSSYCIHTYTNITTCTNYVAHSKSAVRVEPILLLLRRTGGTLYFTGARGCPDWVTRDNRNSKLEAKKQCAVSDKYDCTLYSRFVPRVFFSGDLHLLQSKGLCWNRFRTSQGPCHANLHKWGLAQSPSCDCGQRQSMNHIVDTCVDKFINKTWRWTESTPRSGWWRSHMAGI